jgi:hypothetical protein
LVAEQRRFYTVLCIGDCMSFNIDAERRLCDYSLEASLTIFHLGAVEKGETIQENRPCDSWLLLGPLKLQKVRLSEAVGQYTKCLKAQASCEAVRITIPAQKANCSSF